MQKSCFEALQLKVFQVMACLVDFEFKLKESCLALATSDVTQPLKSSQPNTKYEYAEAS
jgi:hypothetical protein